MQRIVGPVRVPSGATLTVLPGTVVKFNSFAGLSITVEGTLIADGTPAQPIVFTAFEDDSAGGDTNNNGPSTGSFGYWNALRFQPGSTASLLDNVEVRFAGSSSFGMPASVVVDQAGLTMTNSVVRSSDTHGLRIISSNPTITGVTFGTNLGGAASMNLASNPAISNVTVSGNGANALLVDSGVLTGNRTWNDPDIVYRLSGDVTVAVGATLSIAPGQIIKARAFAGDDILVQGTLIADGTPAKPIIFTADSDDSAGGDTNNNGPSVANFGHWNGLRFQPGSTGNLLDNVEVRFGGNVDFGLTASVVVDQAELTLRDSVVRSSDTHGLRIISSNPTIAGVTFATNRGGAVSMNLASNPAISNVTVSGNGANALLVDSGVLTGNRLWNDPDIVYRLSGDVTVAGGATLSIAPGQIIKARAFAGDDILVQGTLIADGTPAQPIIFTADSDDSAGGDTNNNGPSVANFGHWNGLRFQPGSTGNLLDNVEVRFGGNVSFGLAASVVVDQAELTLRDSVVRSSDTHGLRIISSNPTITGVAFRTNFGGAVSMNLASNPAISNVTVSGNGANALLVDGGVLGGDTIWNDPDIVYRLSGDVTVPAGVTLTVAPGQIIKARAFAGDDILVQGTLIADGTPAQPIIFTADSDDSAGGDTNNNGASAGNFGHWNGLRFQPGSIGSRLDNVEVRFGGSNSFGIAGSVVVDQAELTMTQSAVRSSDSSGVRIVSSRPALSGVTFTTNLGAAISMDLASDATILAPTLTGNGVNGLALDSGSLPADMRWDDPEIVYWLTGGVVVPAGRTLTIAAGQILKGAFLGSGLFVDGVLLAQGTPERPIIGTSRDDDTAGGDTNNNGPVDIGREDWAGIEIRAGSTGSVLDQLDLRYTDGFPGAGGAVRVVNGQATLANSKIRNCAGHGVAARTTGQLAVLNTQITGCGDTAILAESGGSVTAFNNTIDGSFRGVLVRTGSSANLTNNLITHHTSIGVHAENLATVTMAFNDVFNPGRTNYLGLANQTGSNGNISVDPQYFNRANRQFQLTGGSPVIDAGTSDGAPAADILANPRFDDPNVANRGGGAAPFVDLGAFERQEISTSDVDLATLSVSGPATANPGDTVTINWQVRNLGTSTAIGPWSDAIYVSDDPSFSINDRLLGRRQNSADLGPGQSYSAALNVTLTGVLPGRNFVIVRTNDLSSVFEGIDTANNASASVSAIEFATPVLTEGVPLADAFTASGQSRFYRLDVPSGRTLTLALDSAAASGATELFVRRGSLPSQSDFEFSATAVQADQQLTVPMTEPGTYYVLARSVFGAAASSAFTLTARLAGFDVRRAVPDRAGNAGPVTIAIEGTQFTPDATVSLVGEGGTTIVASSTMFDSAMQLHATFDLTSRATGVYDLRVVQGAEADTAADAFTIIVGTPGHLQTRIIAPDRIRRGLSGAVTIEYANDGGADLVAPVLLVEARNAGLRVPGGDSFSPSLEILAINTSGPAGILPAGARGSIKLVFLPVADGNVSFSVSEVLPETAFDWNAAKDKLRPPAVPADAWDVIFANLVASLGDTAGEYQAALARNATYLSTLGDYVFDTARLMDFEIAQAGHFGQISERYTIGAFGRGVPDLTDVRAVTDADGNVTIRNGGSERIFFARGPGYRAAPGDTGVLIRVDERFRLRELDGTTTEFRTDGKLDFIQDSNRNRITASYDGAGRPTGISDSFNNQIAYTYNAQGRITAITDAWGRTTTFSYDAAGEHLLSTTSAEGTTQFAYVTGQGAAREHALASITYIDGTRQLFEYDALGRLSRDVFEGGVNEYRYSYDSPGGVTTTDASGARSTLFYNERGDIGAVQGATDQVARFVYDANHRLVRVDGPAGPATLDYGSDGKLRISDARGEPLELMFGRGRFTGLRDPRGQTIRLSRDARGNLTSIIDPNGSTERYRYDATGALTQMTDRRGNTTFYSYNAKNLLARQEFADGSSNDFTYDAHGNLVTATDSRGVTRFEYDAADRITGLLYPNGRSLHFTYDAAGRRTRSVDQSGFTTDYSYDSLGRVQELTGPAGRIVAYAYDTQNRLTREIHGNGTATDYSYFVDGSTRSIVHRAVDGSALSQFEYAYDDRGHVASVTTLAGTTHYTYDAVGQLAGVHLPGGRTITYQYDAVGNRISVSDSGATTDYTTNSLNQYTSAGTTTFAYDAEGNLVSKTDATGTTTYAYDLQGRLESVQAPAERFDYEYDVLGNRIAVTRNGVRTEYLIDPVGLGNVVGEYDSASQLVARYTHAIGLTSRIDAAGAAHYYNFDLTGNTTALTGPAGNVVASYAYLPFGEPLGLPAAAPNPFTFGGQLGVMRETNGLYFMRNRFYDSSAGRFVSRDPIGLVAGDPNDYRFVSNQPTGFTDPSGLATVKKIGLGAIRKGLETIAMHPAIRISLAEAAAHARDIFSLPYSRLIRSVQVLPPTAGLGIIAYLAYKDRPGRPAGAFLNDAVPAVIGGTFFTGGLAVAAQTVSWIAAGTGSVGVAAAYTAGILYPTAVAIAVGGTSYLVGYGIQKIPVVGDFIKLAAQGASGIIIRNFFPPEKTDLGERGKILQKFCGDLVEGQTDECRRRLAEAGVAQVNPVDPNDIGGPAGFGPQRFVTPDTTFPYTILFENKPDSTAPAVHVRITQQLDSDLDWTTFELGDFGFGNLRFEVPPGRRFYSTRVDYTAERGEYVDFSAGIDLDTGLATWTFTSIDPATGEPVTDPDGGFLPPNRTRPEGDGFANYRILLKPSLPTGTTIDAQASIVFDTNDPLETPHFINTIDAGPPTSSVTPLAAQVAPSFTVSWNGTDDAGGSGIASFDIFVSDNGGPFQIWLDDTPDSSAEFNGLVDHSYAFYSVATDNLGHREAAQGTAQATTRVRPPDTTPPTLLRLSATGAAAVASLSLTFSEPLAAAAATTSNFLVRSAGRDKRLGTADDAAVALASATLAAPNTILLTLASATAIKLNQFFSITAFVAAGPGGRPGITDPAGNRLDGDRNGTGGDDLALFAARGTKFSYVDRDGDTVSLSLKGGSMVFVQNAATREGESLDLAGTTASSILSGVVKRPKRGATAENGRTTLQSITGLSPGRNSLPAAQFLIPAGRISAAIVDAVLELDLRISQITDLKSEI